MRNFSGKVVFAIIVVLACAPSTRAAQSKPEMVLQIGHLGQVADIAFSPDGKTMASAARGMDAGFGEVKLWDMASGDLKRDFKSVPADVNAVAFSPDSETLVTAAWDGTVQLWSARSGALERTFAKDESGAVSLLFLDAQTLIKAGGGPQASGEISVWNVTDGTKRRSLSAAQKNLPDGLDDRRVLALSRNREALVSITGTTVRVWSTRHWKLLCAISFPDDAIKACVISSDGRTLVISLENSEAVRFYDVATGKLKCSWRVPDGHATSLALSPDSRILIGSLYGGGDMGLVRWWRTSDGKILRTQKTTEYGTEIIALSTNGKTLLTSGGMWEASIKCWDAASGRLLRQPTAISDDIQALSFAPDGSTLGAAQNDGTVRLWNGASGALQQTIDDAGKDAEVGDVNLLAFSPEGSTLVTGGGRNFTLHLWNWKTARRAPNLTFERSLPFSAAFSPDGTLLAATCSDLTTRLWNPHTGALLRILANGEKDSTAIHGATAFSHDGKTLVTSGKSHLYFWNPQTGQQLFEIMHSSVEHAEFSRDDVLLAADDWTDGLRIHDVRSRGTLWERENVLDFVWAPDGQSLWCRNSDKTISRHESQTGKEIQSWNAFVGNERFSDIEHDVTAWLTIHPDGKVLAGKSDEQSIHLWNARDGRLLSTFRTLPTPLGVTSKDWIAFTPEGYYTGSKDCEKYIRWRVGEKLFPAVEYSTRFHRPDLVAAALSEK